MPENNKLTKLVDESKSSKDSLLFNKIEDVLKEYSANDTYLSTIVDSKTNNVITRNVDGKAYIPIFTEQDFIHADGNSIVTTSVNNLIKPLLYNPKLGGVVLNPLENGICITIDTILQMIFGKREYYKEEKHEWGKGIPSYTKEDILDKKSLLDFGIEVVSNCCNNIGIKNIYYSNDINACPNMIIKKDGKPAFVLVNVTVAPEMPKLGFKDRELLLKRSKQFGFDCYYAPVGIGAADPERFDKSLALRGDAFYANFVDLEKIEE